MLFRLHQQTHTYADSVSWPTRPSATEAMPHQTLRAPQQTMRSHVGNVLKKQA